MNNTETKFGKYFDLKIQFAEQFAKHYHRLESQVRDFNGQPYETHLEWCVNKLMSYREKGIDVTPQMIMVMWLHDTDEDTKATHSLISSIFDREVATGVYFLTNPKYKEGTSSEEKLKEQINRIRNAWGWVQTLKYIDIMHNTSDSLEDPKLDRKWAAKYGAKKLLILEQCKGGNELIWKDAYQSAKKFSQVK